MAKRSYHHGNLRVALVKAALKAIAEDGPDMIVEPGSVLEDPRDGTVPAAPNLSRSWYADRGHAKQ